jgi:putative oxidoreductase
MKPDLQNKWMEAELGTFEEGPPQQVPQPVAKPSVIAGVWDFIYAIARIVMSLTFALHGAQKLIGLFGGGPIQPDSTMLSMGLLEFIGGVALALGIYTRPIALILCVEMAWVYYKLCTPGTVWPIPNNGEFPALFCALFLFLAAFGPGNISVDRMKRRA